MINLRILSSTIACKKHLYFHTSSPAVFTFHLLYTICWRVLNHRQWGSVCLKYLGKSRLPLDVKRIHSKIVLTISKTNRAKSGIFSIKPHSRTTEPENVLMHEEKALLGNKWLKGGQKHPPVNQWMLCFSPQCHPSASTGDNERSQVGLGSYGSDTQVPRGFFVSTPAAAEIRIEPSSSSSITEQSFDSHWAQSPAISSPPSLLLPCRPSLVSAECDKCARQTQY